MTSRQPADHQPDVVLAVHGVESAYGNATALRGVSLSVARGSAVALLGANGAGKTTTIRAVAGLLGIHGGALTGGEVEFNGRPVVGLGSHSIARLGVAHVPEGRLMFSGLTVEENLEVGAAARTTPGADETRSWVYETFPILGERRRSAAGLLSGGEQQMLAIGRALMADPSLILLDEISLGLAPLVTRRIFEDLAAIREQTSTSMLVVEQNATLALEFCDSAYILENGRVVHQGLSAALRDDPQVQELYLGGAPGEAERSFAQARIHRRRQRWLA
ncbi:ABC transporter ATP-binding protein [Nocardioides humi]|uniref:ABC transporter ATP-binding protein n=1 Tax=Nocardioides humi TaxID=449461 RepID=UPI0031D8B281